MLRLSFVTGTEPGKWFTRFRDRTRGNLIALDSVDPLAQLIHGHADLALVRLPDKRVSDEHHVVTLYEESPGIALPKDSELTLLDKLTRDDIEDEIIQWEPPASGSVDVEAVRAGLQVVAANVGVLIAPRPLIKVLSRKQIEHRDFDGGVPATRVALVWHKDADSELIQTFVGIARGRTAHSSRDAAPKRRAREKALAKQERRAAVKKTVKKTQQGPRRSRRRR